MTKIETIDIWLCADCGVITANGCECRLDTAGAGHAADCHSRIMGDGDFVVSGCPEGDPCDFAPDPCARCGQEPSSVCDAAPAFPDVACVGYDPGQHVCRYDLSFSSVTCECCRTTLGGHRFAAVEFLGRE